MENEDFLNTIEASYREDSFLIDDKEEIIYNLSGLGLTDCFLVIEQHSTYLYSDKENIENNIYFEFKPENNIIVTKQNDKVILSQDEDILELTDEQYQEILKLL